MGILDGVINVFKLHGDDDYDDEYDDYDEYDEVFECSVHDNACFDFML